jgi:molybdate transport repressor ModE-like protein
MPSKLISNNLAIEMYLNAYRFCRVGEVGVLGRIDYDYKVWLVYKGKPLIGRGRYLLLKNIDETKSLKESAERLGLSYKTAYNYIKKIEERLGEKVVRSHRGGRGAGGYTELTLLGKELMRRYVEVVEKIK